MSPKTTLILSALGGLAGLIAYQAYEVSQLTSGLVVLFVVGWFFQALFGFESFFKLISLFKNPFMTALMIAGLGFTYWTFQGNLFGASSMFAFGMMFLGVAFGSWLCMLWVIGE